MNVHLAELAYLDARDEEKAFRKRINEMRRRLTKLSKKRLEAYRTWDSLRK